MLRTSALAFLGYLAASVAALPSPVVAAAAADTRPNILLIVADDAGYTDIGSFGGGSWTIQRRVLGRTEDRLSELLQVIRAAQCPVATAPLYPAARKNSKSVIYQPANGRNRWGPRGSESPCRVSPTRL